MTSAPESASGSPEAGTAPPPPRTGPAREPPQEVREGGPEPESPEASPIVEVAVGVLIDAAGRFLLTSRPTGKVYAGYWEFPGGKLEPGETVDEALARELQEELGISIVDPLPWRVERVDYPHARVRLHFRKVFRWEGALQMREGQRMAWQTLPVEVSPVLRGTRPVLAWFAEERGFEGDILGQHHGDGDAAVRRPDDEARRTRDEPPDRETPDR